MAYMRKTLRLGELLVKKGIITEEQLTQALEEQKAKGIKLGEAITSLGFVKQEVIDDLLCEQLGIELVNLRKLDIDEHVLNLVDESVIRKYSILPFAVDEKQANVLKVAMENPMDIMAIDDI